MSEIFHVSEVNTAPGLLEGELSTQYEQTAANHEHWDDIRHRILVALGWSLSHDDYLAMPEWERKLLLEATPSVDKSNRDTDQISDVDQWVSAHVQYNDSPPSYVYVGELPPVEKRQEIAVAIYREYSSCPPAYFHQAVRGVSDEPLSKSCAHAIMMEYEGIEYVAQTVTDFEDGITVNKPRVDAIMAQDNNSWADLLRYRHLLDPSINPQDIVDQALRSKDISSTGGALVGLPQDIMIPDDTLRALVGKPLLTSVVLELFRQGRFEQLKSDRALMASFCRQDVEIATRMYMTGALSDIRPGDYVAAFSTVPLEIVLVHPELMQGLETEKDVRQLLLHIFSMSEGVLASLKRAPQYVQGAAFDLLSTSQIAGPYMSTLTLLACFEDLPSHSYETILEKYAEKIKSLQSLDLQVLDAVFLGANKDIWDKYTSGLRVECELQIEKDEQYVEANRQRAAQRAAELSYFQEGNYVIEPHEANATLSPEDIVRAFEWDRCVKEAPRMVDQATDKSRRTDKISYLAQMRESVATATSSLPYVLKAHRISEWGALQGYLSTIESIRQRHYGPEQSVTLDNLRDNITFIGKKEYKEAARGIATYWKSLLDADPMLQIYICPQAISDFGGSGATKSDEYMIDRLVAQFSDEELAKYKGRFTIQASDIESSDPNHVRIVLVDDWTISGQQLRSATASVMKRMPRFAGRMEIQLIAASRERISTGLEGVYAAIDTRSSLSDISIPVRAYYLAHHAETGDSSARDVCITGAHSSVDYGFEVTIASLVDEYDIDMPPLTNIVRPYRKVGYKKSYPERMGLKQPKDRTWDSHQGQDDSSADIMDDEYYE